MAFVLNDLSTKLLTQSLLEPGEHVVGKVMGRSQPWYTSFLKFGFLMPYVLFLVTDRRVLLLEHKKSIFSRGYELTSVEWASWGDVKELKAKGLGKSKLRFIGATQRGLRQLTVAIPRLFAPLRKNGGELAAILGAAQRPALPSGMPGPMAFGPAPYGAR